MKLAWIGNALLATSWLLGLGYYHQPDWASWVVVLLLGIACMAGMPLAVPAPGLCLASGLLMLPALWIAPWPHKAALVLAVAGCALLAVRTGGRWLNRLGVAGLTAGTVLLAQSLTIVGYRHFTARFADLPEWLTSLLASLASLTGMEVGADGPRLVMYSMREMHPLTATWSLLVDPVSLGFLVGGFGLIVLRCVSVLQGPALTPARSRPTGEGTRLVRGSPQGEGGRAGEGWSPAPGHVQEQQGVSADHSLNWGELAASLIKCAVAVTLWLPLKVVLLLAIYLHRALRTEYGAELDLIGQFWSPWVHLALLGAPLLLVWGLPRLSTVPAEAETANVPLPWRRLAAAVGMACAAVLLLSWTLLWEPLGARKQGRILVDDYHSAQPWPQKEYDTTRTDRPFDTKWYGRDSSYNYACIYDYASRFFEMSRQTTPLDDAALSRCDVLVLKDPSGAYTDSEKQAVRRFIAGGGGVLFLGDHTSVFGSGVNLNELTREYGFRYRYDCGFGIDSVFDETYRPPLVPHPVVQHVRTMEFATSCTLEVRGSRGRAPMLGTGLKSLGADYHTSNFYPQPRNRPEMRCGAFVQMWATRHGKGRIVAFTDSTIFSNFCVFEPGKSNLMLGMIEWLNRANPWMDLRWPMAVLAVGCLVSAWRRCKAIPGGAWPLVVAGGVLGWTLAVVGVRSVQARAFPFPEPVRPMVMVAVDRTVSDAKLPKNGFISGAAAGAASRYATEFGQLERCILRLGYFFKRAAGVEATQADVIVVPFPNEQDQNVVRDYGELLADYVQRGGKLLVLDGPENNQSRANSLLYRFGLGVKRSDAAGRPASATKAALVVRDPWAAPLVSSPLEVTGGTPFAWYGGRPAAAWKRQGQGLVCVVGFGSRFRDDQMGPGSDLEPQGELKDVFDYLFTLLPAVAKAELPPDGPAPVAEATARLSAGPTARRDQTRTTPASQPGAPQAPLPEGWQTNRAFLETMKTNPAYFTWYSNYVRRMSNVRAPSVPASSSSDSSPTPDGPAARMTPPRPPPGYSNWWSFYRDRGLTNTEQIRAWWSNQHAAPGANPSQPTASPATGPPPVQPPAGR